MTLEDAERRVKDLGKVFAVCVVVALVLFM